MGYRSSWHYLLIKEGEFVVRATSTREAANIIGVSKSMIYDLTNPSRERGYCINGEPRKAKGYTVKRISADSPADISSVLTTIE